MKRIKLLFNAKRNVVMSFIVIAVMLGTIIFFVESRPDINNLSPQTLYLELTEIEGIGPTIAFEIIENGPYQSWQHLMDKVDGVGTKLTQRLKNKFNLRKPKGRG